MREEKIEPQEGEEIQEEIDSDTEMSGLEHESSNDDNDSSEDDDESSSFLENDERTFNHNEYTFQYSSGSIHRFAVLSTAPNQHFSDFSDLNLLSKPRDTNSDFETELKRNEEKLNEPDSETVTASCSESEQEYSNENNDFSEDDDEPSSLEDDDTLVLNTITGHGQTRTLTAEGMLNKDGNKTDLRDKKGSESKTKRQGNPRDFVQTQQNPDKKEQHQSAQFVSQRNVHTDQRQRKLCQSDRPLLRLRLTLKYNERIHKTSACEKRGLTERQNESKELKLQTITQHLEEEEEEEEEEEREKIQKRDTLMKQQEEDSFRIHHRCRQEVENYRSQIHQLKQELERTCEDRDELLERNEELAQKTNHFELEIKNLRRDLENEREESKTNEALIEKQNIQIEQYKKHWTQANGEIATNKDLLQKINTENVQVSETLKKAFEDIKEKDNLMKKKTAENNVAEENEVENERQTRKIHDLQTELRAVAKELEETKSRLSRVMGDRLTDNNPNIADLSDQNRPTKLSERYQELYDNQWTDAFESIHQEAHGEEKTIELLKSIMMHASEFCTEEARKQLNQTAEVFAKGKELPAGILKPLKDIRKALAPEYGKVLFKEYFEHLRGSELLATAKEIPNFVEECFKICWLMKVQDPPVVLGPGAKTGESFNKDHYKAYTKSGDHIGFIVWPALLLHQDGPVLCKGVAQGK